MCVCVCVHTKVIHVVPNVSQPSLQHRKLQRRKKWRGKREKGRSDWTSEATKTKSEEAARELLGERQRSSHLGRVLLLFTSLAQPPVVFSEQNSSPVLCPGLCDCFGFLVTYSYYAELKRLPLHAETSRGLKIQIRKSNAPAWLHQPLFLIRILDHNKPLRWCSTCNPSSNRQIHTHTQTPTPK